VPDKSTGQDARIEQDKPEASTGDRLAALKRQIADGSYETPEKLEVAMRRLVSDLKGVATAPEASREDGSGGECP